MAISVDISVMVCTYNRIAMLRKALESLLDQKIEACFTYEILVVDDGSDDGSRNLIEGMSIKSPVPIRYIQGEGLGIAYARNRGLQAARGEWIAFFDDDQLAAGDWLNKLWLTAKKSGAECVGGTRLLHLSDFQLKQIDSITRAFLGEIKVFQERRKTSRQWFPNTGNSLIKKIVFDVVGTFDQTCLSGGSDIEFFRRVRMANFNVWETPDAVVYHMIPEYRLKYTYLKWTALRSGVSFAKIDFLELGSLRLAMTALARLGNAVIFCFPNLIFAHLRSNKPKILGRKCQIMKAIGYIRKTLLILFPCFSQKSFFDTLEFRKERNIFRN